MNLLLKNAFIITLNSKNETIDNGIVAIKNGRIEYVGPNLPGMDAQYEKIIDCRGKAVMPGFVNGHNHAAMSMFRNYADDLKLMDWLFNKIMPLEDKLTEESAYWGVMLSILEMIRSGTTTFADMYFFMDKVAEAVAESGIRAALSRGLQGSSCDGDDSRILENTELYKKYHNSFNGRIKVMLGPHAVYTCTPDYLRKVSEVSRETGMGIQVHISETRDEVNTCIEKYGLSPVKLLDSTGILNGNTVGAHCVVVDDEDIEILSKRGVSVVHNPSSNMKLASGIAPVKKMIDSGINVCLGTDGAASNNSLDMFKEMREASYLQKVHTLDPTAMTVDEVLSMATWRGAKALGFDSVGRIESGMNADLIILNTQKEYYYPRYNIKSAVIYSANCSDVETVIIDGNIVMENRNMTTLDEERILFEVQRWSSKLTE
jgi:5-methylthioadenosine/S-adenosylhomocysteine deaminase